MQVGAEAYMQIRWIDMVYNSTDPGSVKSGACRNMCSIDETSKLGTPVLMTGGAYPSRRSPMVAGGWLGSWASWLLLTVCASVL
jgi:hypothetical protein